PAWERETPPGSANLAWERQRLPGSARHPQVGTRLALARQRQGRPTHPPEPPGATTRLPALEPLTGASKMLALPGRGTPMGRARRSRSQDGARRWGERDDR